MTKEELQTAVLAALLDYETFKRRRRIKALKQAFSGTVAATVIGGTGAALAGVGRPTAPRDVSAPSASVARSRLQSEVVTSAMLSLRNTVSGVAHFGSGRYRLALAHKERLRELARQLPEGAEVIVMGRTDSSGGTDYNKKLGKLRAKSVARYLASLGIKVRATGSKVGKNGEEGWLARRVDVIVSHQTTEAVAIKLPEMQEPKASLQPSVSKPDALVSTAGPSMPRSLGGYSVRKSGSSPPISDNEQMAKAINALERELDPTPGSSLGWDDTTKVSSETLAGVSWGADR